MSGVWLKLTPPQSPPARYDASMAYDANSAAQYVVLFGGMGHSGALNDTWSFVRGQWTNLTATFPNGSVSPSARYDAAMAYDANSKFGSIVLFGGLGASGS